MKSRCAIKENFLLIFILIFNLGTAHAAPLYYTFEGYIDNFGSDKANEATDAGLAPFSRVSYTLEIDFSGTGSRTLPDGTVEYLSDISGYYYGDYSNDYFYASLIESSYPLLSAYEPLIYDDYTNFNYGVSIVRTYNDAGEISVADRLSIKSQHRTVQDWVIGESIQGFYQYGDEAADTYSIFSTALTLTNISLATVPPPAAVWLFGSGLIAIFGVAKRKIRS